MRPITSPLLQQNNNNNYPCLSAAGPFPLPLKCPRPALPLSSRPELGLTGLPLIRGLRAWALCSRSRHRPGGPLGQAPVSSPRPADVHLSAEWGLALGLDTRRAGIGALVATLQSGEGSSRTQTQSLFLRTTQVPTPQSAGVLKGWLRSRTGGTQAPSAHTVANRTRERSGRRWRKSANHTAGREKMHTRQHRSDQPKLTCFGEMEPRVGSRYVHREESPNELGDAHRKPPRDEQRDPCMDTHRETSPDENRDEHTEWPRDTHSEKSRDEQRDPSRDSHREKSIDEHGEEHGDNHRDEHPEEATDEFRHEQRKKSREEHGDVQRDDHREKLREELSNEHREELRLTSDGEQELEEQHPGSPDCKLKYSQAVHRTIHNVSAQFCSPHQSIHQPIEEPIKESSEEPNEEPRAKLRQEVRGDQEMDSKDCLLPDRKCLVGAQTEDSLIQNTTRTESRAARSEFSHQEKANDTEGPWDSACLCPLGGSTCNSNSDGADPLTVRWNSVAVEEKETDPGELCCSRSPTDDQSFPGSDQPQWGPQRDRSLDSDREEQPEELEFGGFVQALSDHSTESTNHTWTCSSEDGTCSSWDQSEDSWVAFPEDVKEQTDDYGAKWWPLSSEDSGPPPGASLSSGSVFSAVFPSPLDQSQDDLTDSMVPTLTQLLRGAVALDQDSPDQRLLEPFHDLNRMIEQGYRRRAIAVSQERLQWSLGLTPPPPGTGPRAAHRRLSLGHCSHPGLL